MSGPYKFDYYLRDACEPPEKVELFAFESFTRAANENISLLASLSTHLNLLRFMIKALIKLCLTE